MIIVGGLSCASCDTHRREPRDHTSCADIDTPVVNVPVQKTSTEIPVLNQVSGQAKFSDDQIPGVTRVPRSPLHRLLDESR